MNIDVLQSHLDSKTYSRLVKALATLESPPATFEALVSWSHGNDPTALPRFGETSWKKVAAAIQAVQLAAPEKSRVVEKTIDTTITVYEPEGETPTVEAVNVQESVAEAEAQVVSNDSGYDHDFHWSASDILSRRLGVGELIADRLAEKLTDEEKKELVRAHSEGDHMTWINLCNALRFRPRPKPSDEVAAE